MEIPINVRKIRNEVDDVFHYIYNHPELSSEEVECSNYLFNKIRKFSHEAVENFLGMQTSFMARLGDGNPKICIFAEYDALPLGHACGHNIIAAWAYGVFRALSLERNLNGSVYLFGSPAEEGRGKYASSKIKISEELPKMGISSALVVHPGTSWEVSANYFARWRASFVFRGRASHAAGSPENGINALDAAVNFYINCKMVKNSIDNNITTIISEIIKDGGNAVNIIPDRAEVWVDVRSLDNTYTLDIVDKIKKAGEASALSNGSRLEIKELAPFTSTFKKNLDMDKIFYRSAKKFVENIKTLDEASLSRPMGSSDVGNVSQAVPTSQLIIGITDRKIGLHSMEFLEEAGSPNAEEALINAVAAGYDAAKYLLSHQ